MIQHWPPLTYLLHFTLHLIKHTMTTRKQKPVYSVTAYDDATATAVYSCLKTACEAWGCITHYSTIYKWLRSHDTPYQDSKITIKKHLLIRSAYTRRTK